jgi:hypothetical protein
MPASALPAGLPAGTALKNRATLSDCCDVAFHCEDGQENLGRAQIDAFIDRLDETRAGMTVFVRSTLFFNIAFARIRQPFVLVTGGSDWPSPGIHHDALERCFCTASRS